MVLLISISSAQSKFDLGLKGGAAFSTWAYSSLDRLDLKSRQSLSIGIVGELIDYYSFNILTELNYIGKGPSVIIRNLQDKEYYAKLDYLSLPILFKYKPLNYQVNPYLIAGPRIDYLLSSDGNEFIKFNRYDLGLVIGFGLQLYSVFGIEYRYNASITKTYFSTHEKIRNKSMEILINIKLYSL